MKQWDLRRGGRSGRKLNFQRAPETTPPWEINDTRQTPGPIFNVKKVEVSVAQSSPTLCNPLDRSPPGFSIHEIFQERILQWVAISSDPGIKPRSPALKVDSSMTEPQGKPYTGVGCHALLQGIFLTQGLNPDFPLCRQILYIWATINADKPGQEASPTPTMLPGFSPPQRSPCTLGTKRSSLY